MNTYLNSFVPADAARLQLIMERAGQTNSPWEARAYVIAAVACCAVNTIGYIFRAASHVLFAALYWQSLNVAQMRGDLRTSTHCLYLAAVSTCCIFASIFKPEIFKAPPVTTVAATEPRVQWVSVPIGNSVILADPRLYCEYSEAGFKQFCQMVTQDNRMLTQGDTGVAATPETLRSAYQSLVVMSQLSLWRIPQGLIPAFSHDSFAHFDPRFLDNPSFLQHFMRMMSQEQQRRSPLMLMHAEEPPEDVSWEILKKEEEDGVVDLSLSASWEAPSEMEIALAEEDSILEAARKAVLAQPPSQLKRICSFWTRADHVMKEMKYRECLSLIGCQLGTYFDIPAFQKQVDKIQGCRLGQAVRQALDALYEPRQFKSEKARSQALVDALRAGQQSREYQDNSPDHSEAIRFIQTVCYIRHSQIDLGQYCERLVESAVGRNVEQMLSDIILSLANFWRVFVIKNTRLDQLSPEEGGISGGDRSGQKLSGETGYDFDPSRNMNASHRTAVATFKDGHMLEIVRTSTPAKHTGSGAAARLALKAVQPWLVDTEEPKFWEHSILKLFDAQSDADTAITPDYLGFVDGLRSQKKRALHVNLEARTASRERSRWNKRCSLDSEHFSVMAYGLDGDFFYGKGKFKNIATFAQLRTALAERMTQGLGNYFLSPHLNIQPDLLDTLFTQVHLIFFDGREKLARSKEYDEYQAYLFFCYAYLTLHLIKRSGIEVLLAGCTDNIDRGGAFRWCITMLILHLIDKQNDPAYLNRAMNDLLSAPLIVKKQGVIKERAKLVQFALYVFNNLKVHHIERLRKNFSDWELQDLVVPQVPDQGILPSGRTSMTMEEYRAFLKRIDGEKQTLPYRDLLGTFSTMSQAKFMHQINRDKGLIYIHPLAAPITSPETLQLHLESLQLSPAMVTRIMQGSHQGIGDSIFKLLSSRFRNAALETELLPADLLNPFKITLKNAGGIISIEMTQRFKVVQRDDLNTPLVFIETRTTIANHVNGNGEIYYKIILPQPASD